jgi:hypothetical protein
MLPVLAHELTCRERQAVTTITSGRLLIFWNAYNTLESEAKKGINGPYLSDDFGRARPYAWHPEHAELWTIDTTAQPAAWPSAAEARPAPEDEIRGGTLEQLHDQLARYTSMAEEQYDAVVSPGS